MSELKPVGEAPFSVYLDILRREGYTEDAEIMEAFYSELLTTIPVDGYVLTVDEIMSKTYGELVELAESIMDHAAKELINISLRRDLEESH